MKFTKILAVISSLGVSLLGTAALAQSTNPPAPVIVETGKVPIPADIQTLVKKFEKERSAYLTAQSALKAELKDATTKAERDAILAAMEADTAAFLADLKQFRQDLKDEINELKGKLNNQELERLIAEVKHEIEAHNHHAR
jgi:hypothetical protein